MNWTEAQRAAIETRGRRLLVSAGAGSGKTRVLVERFLKLLEDNPDWQVTDIVAVTFTEKAARELVSRIRGEIRSRVEQSRNPMERRRWREHRNALDAARIGTIHSLCVAVLRAHPAEAGLDPAFEVMEEMEAAILLDQAIDTALNEASWQLAPEAEILRQATTTQVKEALRALVRQGEHAAQARHVIARKNADEVVAFWQETIARWQVEAAKALLAHPQWLCHVETLTRISALTADDLIEICRAKVVNLIELATANAEMRLTTLRNIVPAINLRGGAQGNWATQQDLQTVKNALGQLREFLKAEELLALDLNNGDRLAAEQVLHLMKLYERAKENFLALKTARAALDFNDLEEITDRLLENYPEVTRLYQESGRLKALMVDEFQDTSPIQKRILWRLAPHSRELFLIGDAKQSIYRFRGADVTVFEGVRAEFDSGDGKIIGMNTCFRTHTRLIDFVNHLFPHIFRPESLYDTPYEAMNASRAVAHEHPSVEIHVIAPAKETTEKFNLAGLRRLEAACVARRIGELIDGRKALIFDEAMGGRAAEPGDFALLFQASTHFDIYEEALAAAGIPYVTIAGKGFYARQEIADICNLLAFLSCPLDDLSLAAVLRSPMFGFSDEMLLQFRWVGASLWESLSNHSIPFTTDEHEVAAFAHEVLKRLRGLSGRVSAAKLIIAAMRETGYLATMMALPHGERRVANIEKLIEQSYALSALTLSEVVERINRLKFKEAREGEATVEESGAVRLMTVHKSKGLEFPIVWVVDATYRGNREQSILALHDDLGPVLNAREENFFDISPPVAAFKAIRLLEEKMERAEKKRLLYVAATRARDHLMISGALGKARLSGEHWLGQIAAALDIEGVESSTRIDYPNGSIDLHWHDAKNISAAVQSPFTEKPEDLASQESDRTAESVILFPLLRRL